MLIDVKGDAVTAFTFFDATLFCDYNGTDVLLLLSGGWGGGFWEHCNHVMMATVITCINVDNYNNNDDKLVIFGTCPTGPVTILYYILSESAI